MKKNKLLIWILTLALFSQCKRVEEPGELGTSYYPLKLGKYWCYVMDSLVYDGFSNQADSFHYLVRETIESEQIDNEGELGYRIEVEIRPDSTVPWKFSHFEFLKKTDKTLERTTFDRRVVELSFPIVNRKTWDENEYNTSNQKINQYIAVDEPYSVDSMLYPLAVEVDRGDIVDAYFTIYGRSVFAKNIGLVYEQQINTQKQQETTHGNAYTKILYQTNW